MDRPGQININLLEHADRIKPSIYYWALVMLLAAALLSCSGYFYLGYQADLARLQAEKAEITQQLSSLAAASSELASIQTSEQAIQVKRKTVEKLHGLNISHTEFINEIDRAVPPLITMVEVEITGSKVVLTGYSPDHTQVARLMEGLKNIPRAENVTVFVSELNEKTNEVKYKIEMNWGTEQL
jgi:Tfp pilus assembly protein PilN